MNKKKTVATTRLEPTPSKKGFTPSTKINQNPHCSKRNGRQSCRGLNNKLKGTEPTSVVCMVYVCVGERCPCFLLYV